MNELPWVYDSTNDQWAYWPVLPSKVFSEKDGSWKDFYPDLGVLFNQPHAELLLYVEDTEVYSFRFNLSGLPTGVLKIGP